LLTTAQVGPVRDKGIYREKQPGFFQNTILKQLEEYSKKSAPTVTPTYFTLDLSHYNLPTNIGDYTQYWHNAPVSQGVTGTCWCFSATSFLESEAYRLNGIQVKLSEMYIVYWEYVERARAFVKNKGDMHFAEGSEANAVIRMMKMYGAVPLEAYPGKPADQPFYDHRAMMDEMESYLKNVKESNAWNEKIVIETIQDILRSYMGEPPKKFTWQGKEYTPGVFLTDVLKLNLNDYYSFMSTMALPYNQRGELEEPDNWWHSTDYYNVSLDDFFMLITNALTKGYTVSNCGDVSEPGHLSFEEVSVIPTFDIPADYIDEYSRQMRIVNETTTDDHCIHIVGYLLRDGQYWFLIKDSGSGAYDGPHKGYRFMHQDYVKLKMLTVMMHKDAAKPVLDKIIK
jgi:bleomycin hydrolase